MRTWSKILIFAGIWGSGVLGGVGVIARAAGLEVTAAVHAIEQAPDPSAVVAGYANGMAVDRNNPRLHEAYVSRMVDFGLPELAYRQARTLTTLVSTNGLAWGVVAHVDARRGDMPGAVSAINLAGEIAPDHPFVQRTAGEIIAWHDWAADRAELPENARRGLAEIRRLLETKQGYAAAYETARKAYQAEAQAEPAPQGEQAPAPPPDEQRPSLVETNAAQIYGVPATPAPDYQSYYPYPYYPYYGFDPGPRWIEPAPWWWWRPVGYFSGVHFIPYASVLVYHRHHWPRHRDHFRHDRPDKRPPIRDHSADNILGHSLDSLLPERGRTHNWHGDRQGRRNFFGRPAEPNDLAGRSVTAPQPSWNVLARQGRLETSPSLPGRAAGSPSWSGLRPQGQVVVPSTRPNAGVRGAQPMTPRPGSPSWSGMGRVSPGLPPTSRSSAPPSWSGFGRNSAPAASSAAPPRSSSAPSSRGQPSWSGFGR